MEQKWTDRIEQIKSTDNMRQYNHIMMQRNTMSWFNYHMHRSVQYWHILTLSYTLNKSPLLYMCVCVCAGAGVLACLFVLLDCSLVSLLARLFVGLVFYLLASLLACFVRLFFCLLAPLFGCVFGFACLLACLFVCLLACSLACSLAGLFGCCLLARRLACSFGCLVCSPARWFACSLVCLLDRRRCWQASRQHLIAQVPFKYIPKDVAGLAAIPSFGIGALVAGIIVTSVCLGQKKAKRQTALFAFGLGVQGKIQYV